MDWNLGTDYKDSKAPKGKILCVSIIIFLNKTNFSENTLWLT